MAGAETIGSFCELKRGSIGLNLEGGFRGRGRAWWLALGWGGFYEWGMSGRHWFWRWDGVLVAGTLLAIRVYQVLFSRWLPRVCVFNPSCSEYACLALKEAGWVEGVRKAWGRVGRCRGGEFQGDDFP